MAPKDESKWDVLLRKIEAIDKKLETLEELEKGVTFISEEVNDIKNQMQGFKRELCENSKEINTLKAELIIQKRNVQDLRGELEILQNERNAPWLEIKNIPVRQGEDLGELISRIAKVTQFKAISDNILEVFRVKGRGKEDSVIKVKLDSADLRDNFLASCKKAKCTLRDIKIGKDAVPFYVNELVSPSVKKLMYAAVKFKKENNFAFCWIKHGRVLLRKSPSENPIFVKSQDDLDKLG